MLAITACAPADEDPTATDPGTDIAATSAPTDESAAPADQGEEPAAPAAPVEDVGNGVVRVAGAEYPDFEGECDISNGFGGEDVGELSTDLNFLVGIDNTVAYPDAPISFVVLGADSILFRDLSGRPETAGLPEGGTVDSLTEVSDRVADGSRDIVTVRFAGTLDDGTAIEADVVCKIQNAF
jgi:hypothetical protein